MRNLGHRRPGTACHPSRSMSTAPERLPSHAKSRVDRVPSQRRWGSTAPSNGGVPTRGNASRSTGQYTRRYGCSDPRATDRGRGAPRGHRCRPRAYRVSPRAGPLDRRGGVAGLDAGCTFCQSASATWHSRSACRTPLVSPSTVTCTPPVEVGGDQSSCNFTIVAFPNRNGVIPTCSE